LEEVLGVTHSEGNDTQEAPVADAKAPASQSPNPVKAA
jgi:hypothetical protein